MTMKNHTIVGVGVLTLIAGVALADALTASRPASAAPTHPEPAASAAREPPAHTRADAQRLIDELGGDPAPATMVRALDVLAGWTFSEDDEDVVAGYTLALVTRLRRTIHSRLASMTAGALLAATSNGRDAQDILADAADVLMLYPPSDEPAILKEQRGLSTNLADLASRLFVMRRQRYNSWATRQIRGAIDGYNAKSSYFSPLRENDELIDSLVAHLGAVDPVLLEPMVADIYAYALDLTKGSISESEKTSLAARLTDPSIVRKSLGDF
jgi:hypothetical protein